MINLSEVIETNRMILEENLDVRTITMGISLLDCAGSSLAKTCAAIEAKLKANGLTWYKQTDFLDDEKLYQTTYETEVIING